MGKAWFYIVWLYGCQTLVGEVGFERVLEAPLKHPALISSLGDPASGNLNHPSRLWWPSDDLLIQGHDSTDWDFSLWDPATLRRTAAIKSKRTTLSEDGKYLAVPSYDKETKTSFLTLLTFPEGKLLWKTEAKVHTVAFASEGDWLVGARTDRPPNEIVYTLLKIDLATGKVLNEFRTTHPRKSGTGLLGRIEGLAANERSVFFSTKEESFTAKISEEERKAIAGERLQRLDAATWEVAKIPFDYRQEATRLQVSPDGKFLALVGWQSSCVVTESFDRIIGYGRGEVAFSPDGDEVAMPSRQSVSIFELASGETKKTFDFGALGIAYSPDGKEICFCDSGGLFRHDAETWEPAEDADPYRQTSVPREVLMAPNGNFVAALDVRAIHLWDLKHLRLSHTLVSPRGHTTCFHGLAVLANGTTVIASDGYDLLRWDLPDDAFSTVGEANIMVGKKLDLGVDLGTQDLCHCVAVQHDGTLNKLVVRWGTMFHIFRDGQVNSFQLDDVDPNYNVDWALRPQTNELVYRSRLKMNGKWTSNLSRYDVVAGKALPRWKHAPGTTVFSPDGTQLVSASKDGFRFYDVDRRKEASMLDLKLEDGFSGMIGLPTWSPNGRMLAATIIRHFDEVMPHRLGLWDLKYKKLLGVVTIPGPVPPSIVRFSPSNDKILTVHSNKSLLLWDAKKIVALGDKKL